MPLSKGHFPPQPGGRLSQEWTGGLEVGDGEMGGGQAHFSLVQGPAGFMPQLPSWKSKDADPTNGPEEELRSEPQNAL